MMPADSEPQASCRALFVGSIIGIVLCCSNMYFGLQTGWITMASVQAAVLGFGVLRSVDAICKVSPRSSESRTLPARPASNKAEQQVDEEDSSLLASSRGKSVPHAKSPEQSIFAKCCCIAAMSWASGFTPLENVALQTTAVAAGTMPLAGGFVGIIPALTLLGRNELELEDTCAGEVALQQAAAPEAVATCAEHGPHDGLCLDLTGRLNATAAIAAHVQYEQDSPQEEGVTLSWAQQLGWCAALAFFGVFLAVPLRRDAIEVQKLKFPSGTATAAVIGALHGETGALARAGGTQSGPAPAIPDSGAEVHVLPASAPKETLAAAGAPNAPPHQVQMEIDAGPQQYTQGLHPRESAAPPLGPMCKACAAASGVTVLGALVPVAGAMPVLHWLGAPLQATQLGWYVSPSLSYVGQGMIMGLRPALSMGVGALLAWGILAPLAMRMGWAPGPVSSWTDGAKGWVVWVSLGIMLGESVVTLGSTVVRYAVVCCRAKREAASAAGGTQGSASSSTRGDIPMCLWVPGLFLSSALCALVVPLVFKVPFWEPLVALLLCVVVAVIAVRALGETDLNPVSGVGKIAQAAFACMAPGRIVSNLLAGAVAEAGAQQAGDLMQDLKTGYLLGAFPISQLWAQLVGSLVGVVATVGAYQLFTAAYTLGGPTLQVPTAQVWLDMARLAGGQPLPANAPLFAGIGAGLSMVIALVQMLACDTEAADSTDSRIGRAGAEQRAQQTQRGELEDSREASGEESGARGLAAAGVEGRERRGTAEDASSPLMPAEVELGGTAVTTSSLGAPGRWRCPLWLVSVRPSLMAVAVGMYISPSFVLPRVLGALAMEAWRRGWLAPCAAPCGCPESAGHSPTGGLEGIQGLLVATGFVLGEGTTAIGVAVAKASGLHPLTCAGCVPGLCSGCS